MLRVIDRDTNTTVYKKVKSMNGYIANGTGIDAFQFDGDPIDLDAGNYRLVIRMTASDSGSDQFNFTLATAYSEVEGYVVED